MFVQYRHAEYGEHFWSVDEGVHRKYIKSSHGRARLIEDCQIAYKGRPVYRTFKKNHPVLVLWKRTPENAWMEVECKHEVVPFDNDKQCVHCGTVEKDFAESAYKDGRDL